MLDIAITGGTLVDGTGSPAKRGDLGIRAGRIAALGALSEPARTTIDATGKVVLPGFVNTHHHLPQTLTRNVPSVQQAPLFRWLTELYQVWRHADAAAVGVAARVGLAELLLTVAATIRERDYLRRHVRALSAEGRLSAYVLGGLPPGFLAYLAVTKWDYTGPMFTTPVGWGLCVGMAVLLGVGFFWMMKVSKVDV